MKKACRMVLFNCFLFVFLCLAAQVAICGAVYEVVRLVPRNDTQLQNLIDLFEDFSSDDGLDFWTTPRSINQSVDIMIPPELKSVTEEYFKEKSIPYNMLIPDVEKAINEVETSPTSGKEWIRYKRSPNTFGFDFQRYNDYDTIMMYLDTVSRRYPAITELRNLGWSHEGRRIPVLKIGKDHGFTKRAIWVDGGIHAREWPSPHVAIYFIHQLVTNYGKDAKITYYLDNMNWYIAPMINPDGYIFSRSRKDPKVRLWRKNRSPRKCYRDERFSTFREHCCRGVDLNRNFDHYFQGRGTKHFRSMACKKFQDPSSYQVIYGIITVLPGQQKYLQLQLRRDPRNKIDAFVSLHTYGQIVIHPYGHRKAFYPPDIAELSEIGVDAASALGKRYNTHYRIGSTADILYLASGTAVDWAKSKARIKYTFLLEMRPDRETITNVLSGTGGFLMPERHLLGIAEETWEAMKVIADAVLRYNNLQPPS